MKIKPYWVTVKNSDFKCQYEGCSKILEVGERALLVSGLSINRLRVTPKIYCHVHGLAFNQKLRESDFGYKIAEGKKLGFRP